MAAYPEEVSYQVGLTPYEDQPVYHVQSIYEVYCTDCNNFVNLLTGETINDKGLVRVNLRLSGI
jgi:hypothetical protein